MSETFENPRQFFTTTDVAGNGYIGHGAAPVFEYAAITGESPKLERTPSWWQRTKEGLSDFGFAVVKRVLEFGYAKPAPVQQHEQPVAPALIEGEYTFESMPRTSKSYDPDAYKWAYPEGMQEQRNAEDEVVTLTLVA